MCKPHPLHAHGHHGRCLARGTPVADARELPGDVPLFLHSCDGYTEERHSPRVLSLDCFLLLLCLLMPVTAIFLLCEWCERAGETLTAYSLVWLLYEREPTLLGNFSTDQYEDELS